MWRRTSRRARKARCRANWPSQWDEVANGRAAGWFIATKGHMAPNGFLHAAAVIALVDSACGYGCVLSLPEGATGFTTIELKTNYLGTASDGDGRLRGPPGPRRAHDPGLGRRSAAREHRQDHRPLPLHADGPLPQGLSALARGRPHH